MPPNPLTPEGVPFVPIPAPRVFAWQEYILAALLIAAVFALNVWTVESTLPKEVKLFGGDKQGDYSNLTVDGFLAGHLYIQTAPPPELVHAENPYEPTKRPPGSALSDVSYYKGHYYVYFGVAPVVTVFLPWRLLTGHDLPAAYAALLFVNGAYLAAVALFWGLRRRYFGQSSPLVLAIGVLMLGLASMSYAVLRRTSIWEPPVAAGYLYSSVALLCLYLGLHSRRTVAWFAGAGLMMGLAVGSRPTLAVGAAAFAAPLILAFFGRAAPGLPRDRGKGWLWTLALGLPFAAVMGGLLTYNFERFQDPFEFGLHYQLTGAYEAAVRHFSAAYVPFNAFVYYLAPAHWSRYFPFVGPIRLPPAPVGYDTCEYVYGMLTNVPFVGFALLAPLALWQRRPEEKGPLGTILAAVGTYYVFVGFLLLFFVTSTARYMVDFAPTLTLLACVGLLSAERRLGRPARRALLVLAGAAGAFSAAVCLLLNVQLLDLLRQLNPRLYGALAHAGDTPAAWVEGRVGTVFGPVEMTLRFPKGRVGRMDPLISTGCEAASDYLFVKYFDGHVIRMGFEHRGYPIRWSEPIAIDFKAEHVVRANMGSFYPPRNHPMFDSWDDVAYGAQCRWLSVTFDGAPVFDEPQDFYDSSPGLLRMGSESIGTHGGVFTGTILNVQRLPFTPQLAPRDPSGPVEFVLAVPHAPGLRTVPLLTAGRKGHADGVFLSTVRPGFVRFSYSHRDDAVLETGDIALADTASHTLVLSVPDQWSDRAGSDPRLRNSLYLALDGRVVAFQEVPAVGPRKGALHFGSNAAASTWGEAVYPWPIRSVRAVAIAVLASDGAAGALTAPQAGEDVPRGPGAGGWKDGEDGHTVGRAIEGAALGLWLFLFVWICGRLGGTAWRPLIRRMAGPALGTGARIRDHGVMAVGVALAIVAAAMGVRSYESYLASAGPLHLRLELPEGYWGRAQTILATGTTGAGANVFITYADRHHVRVGADVWGKLYKQSAPIAVDYDEPLDVVISTSGLYPREHPLIRSLSPALLGAVGGQLRIEVNGEGVLSVPGDAYDSSVRDVTVGYTDLGFSYSEHRFAGRILSAERLPVPHALTVRKGQSLDLRFRTDPNASLSQPLVSLGEGGVLGLCTVEPSDDNYAALSLRRPGSPPIRMARFRDDPGIVHSLSLVPGYVGSALPTLAFQLTLDGVQVSNPKGFQAFDTCPTVTAFTEMAVSNAAPFFHGPYLTDVLRGEPEAVPNPAAKGPLLIVLNFPGGQTGADPLLVTGVTGTGDVLYVQYVGPNGVRFGLDHWGYGGPVGNVVTIDPQVPHRLEVETGALEFPQIGTKVAAPVRVRLDGAVVLEGSSPAFPFAPSQFAVGKNIIGGSTCGPEFRGQFWVVEHRPKPEPER